MTPGIEEATREVARVIRESAALGGALAASRGWVHAVATGTPGDDGDPATVQVLGRRRHLHQALLAFFPRSRPPVTLHYDGSLPGLLARRHAALREAEGATVRLVDRVAAFARLPDGGRAIAPYLRARLVLAPDLDAQLAQVRSRQLRSRLRRLARTDGRFTVTRRREDLRRFYRTLYVPQAMHRFGRLAHLESESGLARILARRGALLLVHRGPDLVGGALVYRPRTEPGVLVWAKLGLVAAADLSPAARGEATATLELAVIRHALDLGVGILDLGLCSASLEDGVLIHKLRLGARLSPLPEGPRFALALDPAAAPALARLAPFVAEIGGRLHAVVGYGPPAAPPDPARWAARVRDRIWPGLEGIEVRVPAALATPDLAARLTGALGTSAPPVRVEAAP